MMGLLPVATLAGMASLVINSHTPRAAAAIAQRPTIAPCVQKWRGIRRCQLSTRFGLFSAHGCPDSGH